MSASPKAARNPSSQAMIPHHCSLTTGHTTGADSPKTYASGARDDPARQYKNSDIWSKLREDGRGFSVPPDRVERKLTTILAADVAGYSRLMSLDEERTLADLKTYSRVFIDQ